MELKRILSVLTRRAPVVLVTAIAAAAAAFMIVRTVPVTYSASALLHVPTSPVGSDWRQYDLDYADRLMNTYVSLAETRRVAAAVADRLGRADAPHLAVEVVPNTELMRAVARGSSPQAAVAAADTLASVLIEFGADLADQLRPGSAPPSPMLVEAAIPPTTPRGVSPAVLLAFATALGALFGILIAFVAENLDPRVFDLDELTHLAGVPIIGTVPRISKRAGSGLAVSDSPAGQAFRSLRAQLTARNGGAALGAVLIVGAERGDGASTTVANLAQALANIGRRTVVIDCDTAEPAQQSLLGVKGRTKLSSKSARSDTAKRFALTTTVDNVRLVDAKPSEVPNLLGEFTTQVDTVLIDVRPLSESGDALFLASLVDGIVLTVRRGHVRSASLVDARDQLRTTRTRTLGMVVTHTARSHHRGADNAGVTSGPRSRFEETEPPSIGHTSPAP